MVTSEKIANLKLFHREIASPHRDGSTSNSPLLLVIEPTTRCNFQCIHCSHTYANQTRIDLSLELFGQIAPALKAALELYLFGDGEVLLDIPRHLAMISCAYQHDSECALGFSTNGKLLTPEVYELYATAGVQYIQVSIDAATRELYENMRRGGSFNELISNLKGIAALRRQWKTRQPLMYLATVISRQNYRQLPLLADFVKRYGFAYWYINAEYPHNAGRDALSLTKDDLPELERIKADIERNYSSHYTTDFDTSIGLQAESNQASPKKESPVFCTVPWQRFEVKANGDVKVCPYYHQPVSSMNGKSLEEVWNGPEFRRLRRVFASGRDLPHYCIDCKSSMKGQYLPGFSGDPGNARVGLLGRMIRGARKVVFGSSI